MTKTQKPRKPMKLFLFQMFLVLIGVWMFGSYIGDRITIGVQAQQKGCLPYTWYVIDKYNKTIPAEGYVAFLMDDRAMPWYEPGTKFIKQLKAVKGDQVVVKDSQVLINGTVVATLDSEILAKLKKTPDDFKRNLKVPESQMWVMGTTPDSFDSRYWGPIDASMVEGRVYPIF